MRYSGKIGLAVSAETAPGVWEDTITEVDILGELTQRTEALATEGTVIPTYRTVTSVSILLGGPEKTKYENARYLSMDEDLFTISTIQHQYPRLIFYIGDFYDGPTPE